MEPKAFRKQLIICPYNIPDLANKLYGSRRILQDNASYTADFDIYLHVSELSVLGTSLFELKASNLLREAASDYISSVPKYGKVYLITKLPTNMNNRTHADILIFSDKRDVEIMDKTLQFFNDTEASSFLVDRPLRISLYNYVLQLNGFTPNKTCTFSTITKIVYDQLVKTYCKDTKTKYESAIRWSNEVRPDVKASTSSLFEKKRNPYGRIFIQN